MRWAAADPPAPCASDMPGRKADAARPTRPTENPLRPIEPGRLDWAVFFIVIIVSFHRFLMCKGGGLMANAAAALAFQDIGFRRHEDFALAGMIGRADQSFLLHPLDQRGGPVVADAQPALDVGCRGLRSEERRVGKEWVSTCISGWSPEH